MAPETLNVAGYCIGGEELAALLGGCRLYSCGPALVLTASEVPTTSIGGEHLRLDQEKALYDRFRRYPLALFPASCTPSSHRYYRPRRPSPEAVVHGCGTGGPDRLLFALHSGIPREMLPHDWPAAAA